jgi:hypothetical protein
LFNACAGGAILLTPGNKQRDEGVELMRGGFYDFLRFVFSVIVISL